jgi:CRP-like cAMP-binding protein
MEEMKADLDRYAPAMFGGVLTFNGVSLPREEASVFVRHLRAIQTCRPNTRLISEGEPLDRPRLIRSGWACRAHQLRDGRRQILNYYLPGDIIGFAAEPVSASLASYVSLTRLMTMDIVGLRALVAERSNEFPVLRAASRRMRVNEEFQLLSHITRIGRQKAHERLAHLLLEFHSRLKRIGLVEGNTFQLPLTQEALADGLGLSAVHVNRTFKLLKGENLIRTERTSVTLLEPELLAEIAGYREAGETALGGYAARVGSAAAYAGPALSA